MRAIKGVFDHRHPVALIVLGTGFLVSVAVFLVARASGALLLDLMIHLDVGVMGFLNQFAGRSIVIDKLVWRIDGNYLLEGGVVMALFWGAWFADDEVTTRRAKRELILASLVSVYVAAVGAIVMRSLLPFRLRPLVDAALAFQLPSLATGVSVPSNPSTSFPSGHAIVFGALAVSLFSVARRLAVIACIYVFVVVCVPRMYLGFHYPTDILGGALVAIATVSVVVPVLRERRICSWLAEQSERHAALFYSIFFLLCLEISMWFPTMMLVIRMVESARLSRALGY